MEILPGQLYQADIKCVLNITIYTDIDRVRDDGDDDEDPFRGNIRSENTKTLTQPTGFEPVRAEPNGFRVHRLNHSATTAVPSADFAKVVEVKTGLMWWQ